MDLGNIGQTLLDRGRDIVQRVTFIVNEDLTRAEFVRDNRPKTNEVAASTIVTSQVKRLAGMNPAVGAWLDEYSRFTGEHGAALLVSHPVLAADLFEFYDAVARAFQFTNGARQWVATSDGGLGAELTRVPGYAADRAKAAVAEITRAAGELGPYVKIFAGVVVAYMLWDIFRPRR